MNRRVDKGKAYKRRRKSDIEFLWIQIEVAVERGKNKDTKTKLALLHRLYQFLAKALAPSTQEKKSRG
jgi:hypothetical protein